MNSTQAAHGLERSCGAFRSPRGSTDSRVYLPGSKFPRSLLETLQLFLIYSFLFFFFFSADGFWGGITISGWSLNGRADFYARFASEMYKMYSVECVLQKLEHFYFYTVGVLSWIVACMYFMIQYRVQYTFIDAHNIT